MSVWATATDLGAPGRDPIYGHGEVEAARALGLPGGAPTLEPWRAAFHLRWSSAG